MPNSTTPLLFEKNAYQSVGFIQYNGVRFPPFCNIEVESESIYDRHSRSSEGIKIRVTVSGVVTPNMFVAVGQTAIREINDQPGIPESENPTLTTDLDIEEIRYRLAQPGRTLVIDNRGVGDKLVIHGRRTHAESGDAAAAQYDIKNGPVPGEFKVTPYSNYSCKIDWSCETVISPCAENKNPLMESPAGGQLNSLSFLNILSFNYATTVTVEKNLTATKRIRGEVVVARVFSNTNPRSPSEQRLEAACVNQWDVTLRNHLTEVVFLKHNQFQRTSEFSLSEDKRTLSFTITDVELATDNPYPRGMAEISVTNSVESGFDSGGFKIWNGSLSVSGEVYPGFPKFLLWQVFQQTENALLRHDYKVERDQLLRGVIRKINTYKSSIKTDDTASRVISNELDKVPVYIRTKLKLTDEVFTRKGSIECQYRMAADLSIILYATGMFLPLPNWLYNLSGSVSRDLPWAAWSAHPNQHAGSGFTAPMVMDMAPGAGAQNLCLATSLGDFVPAPVPLPYVGFGTSESGRLASEANSGYSGYVAYSGSTNLYTDNNSTQYAYMESQDAHRPRTFQNVDAVGQIATRMASIDGLKINQSTQQYVVNDPTTNQPTVIAGSRRTGYPTYRLVITGQAVRWGDAPVIPEVFGFGQRTLTSPSLNDGGQVLNADQLVLGTPIKIGTDRTTRKVIGEGTNPADGKTALLHHASWVKQYLLSHNPTDGTILVDGISLGAGYA
jgi:hypothetical protein